VALFKPSQLSPQGGELVGIGATIRGTETDASGVHQLQHAALGMGTITILEMRQHQHLKPTGLKAIAHFNGKQRNLEGWTEVLHSLLQTVAIHLADAFAIDAGDAMLGQEGDHPAGGDQRIQPRGNVRGCLRRKPVDKL
jgi:hypothetical protein